jgi:hypothetical protein
VAGDGKEGGHPQRVDVAARVHGLAGGLLGAHEVRRPENLRGLVHRVRVGDLGDSEVGHEHPPAGFLEENVVWFDVPMDHALGVGVRQGPGNLAEDLRGIVRLEGALRAHTLTECLALDVCHDDEHELVDFLHGEDGDDVGVGELRRCARLAEKPLPQGRLSCHLAR